MDFDQRILINSLQSEYLIYDFTEIPVIDKTVFDVIDFESLQKDLNLILCNIYIGNVENSLELLFTADLFPKSVEIPEEFLNSDSFHNDFSLDFFHHIIQILIAFSKSFCCIKSVH